MVVFQAYSADTIQSAQVDFKELLGPFALGTYPRQLFLPCKPPIFAPQPTPSAPPAHLFEETRSFYSTKNQFLVVVVKSEVEVAAKPKQVTPQQAQDFVAQAAVFGSFVVDSTTAKLF